MRRALTLAARGRYTTDPNPRVGCVLVRDDALVGEGWHERAGAPHAEVNALEMAGRAARGGTAYVTLEPCCHHGRTGPCTRALIEAGVARVVIAMRDPNPLVDGQGIAALASAGVSVVEDVLHDAAEALNKGFARRVAGGRPWVRCKLAMSLDGRTAMASGESRWISSAPARADVQRLRACSSAVLTGIGTVLADDPALTVRSRCFACADGTLRQPVRVVLDSNLRTPATAKMLAMPGRTWIVGLTDDASRTRGLRAADARVVHLPARSGRVDLEALLDWLAHEQMNEVLVEAGATLAGAMLQHALVDELIVYVAPKLLGDAARGLLHLPGLQFLADAPTLETMDIRAIGPDWRISALPCKRPG